MGFIKILTLPIASFALIALFGCSGPKPLGVQVNHNFSGTVRQNGVGYAGVTLIVSGSYTPPATFASFTEISSNGSGGNLLGSYTAPIGAGPNNIASITVAPFKLGNIVTGSYWWFTPPSRQVTVPGPSSNGNPTGVDFDIHHGWRPRIMLQHNESGKLVGIAGITVTFTRDGATVGTATTDDAGFCTMDLPEAAIYTITPSPSADWTFEPPSTTITLTDSDLTELGESDFVGTPPVV